MNGRSFRERVRPNSVNIDHAGDEDDHDTKNSTTHKHSHTPAKASENSPRDTNLRDASSARSSGAQGRRKAARRRRRATFPALSPAVGRPAARCRGQRRRPKFQGGHRGARTKTCYPWCGAQTFVRSSGGRASAQPADVGGRGHVASRALPLRLLLLPSPALFFFLVRRPSPFLNRFLVVFIITRPFA